MRYAPSTTWIALILPLAALGGIGFLFYTLRDTALPEDSQPFSTAQRGAIAAITNTDTDGDGLKDWEETLWATDIHKNDTDGDGTNDGEEVAAQRNPAFAGPNDSLSQTPPSSTASSSPSTPNTLTTQVTQSMFINYLTLKQDGELSDKDVEQIVDLAVRNADVTGEISRVRPSEIRTTENSSAAFTLYRDQLAQTLLAAESIEGNELQWIEEYMQTKDEILKTKLEHSAEVYDTIANDLVRTTVPQAAAQAHADLANSYFMFAAIVRSFANVYQDPLTAMVMVKAFLTANEQFEAALTGIAAAAKQYI